jgi:adhesin/invasin
MKGWIAKLALVGMAAGCSEKVNPFDSIPAEMHRLTGVIDPVIAGGVVTKAPSVRVVNRFHEPVSGVTVTFKVTAGSGTITGGVQQTDENGTATLGGWSVGTVAGPNTVQATATVLTPMTFDVLGIAGPASKLVVARPPAGASSGAVMTTQPIVHVTDIHGNPVTGSTSSLTVALIAGDCTLTGPLVATAVNGVATFSGLTLRGKVGAATLRFAATGFLPVDATLSLGAGRPAVMTLVSGNGQSGPIRTALPLPLAVRLVDAEDNPVPGFVITFDVATGEGGTNQTTPTNANGIATSIWTLGPVLGSQRVGANVPCCGLAVTGSPVIFTATAGPASLTALSAFGTPFL